MMEQTKQYEYVDLGLPSGLKWATMNVGAETETDYGDYFMWGSTTPNTPDECILAKAPFNGGASSYNDEYINSVKDTVCPNGILAKEYDAAAQIMGGDWRMPTEAEFQELIDYTTKEWATINDVNGYKFIGSNGNSIFIPAAGDCYDGFMSGVGNGGDVWSSSINIFHPRHAWFLGFLSGYCEMGNRGHCCIGRSVRGVMD